MVWLCLLCLITVHLFAVLRINWVVNTRFVETTRPGDGYRGCLFRAQWDNQFPLSRVFQDPRGSNIYIEPPGM